MTTPNSLPDTPAIIGGNFLTDAFGPGFHMSVGIQKMITDIYNAWAKGGVGAANQVAASAGPGRVVLTKADGTTEWLLLHLFNSLLNGGMEEWSLGTSIAVPAATNGLLSYGPDLWSLKTNATQSCHIDQVAGLTPGSQWAARIRRDSGQTGTGVLVFEQAYRLEEIVKLRGDKVSLSLAALCGANFSPVGGNVTIRVSCGTAGNARRAGTAYTGEVTLISQTLPLTTALATPSYVSSVIVPTNATQLSVSIEATPVGTAGAADDFTVDDVMLNRGDVPMAYRARPDDKAQCRRYWFKMGGVAPGDIAFLANGTSGIGIGTSFLFGFEMAAVPVATKVGTWTVSQCAQPGVNASNRSSVTIVASATATNWVQWQTADATTYVTLDARLA